MAEKGKPKSCFRIAARRLFLFTLISVHRVLMFGCHLPQLVYVEGF